MWYVVNREESNWIKAMEMRTRNSRNIGEKDSSNLPLESDFNTQRNAIRAAVTSNVAIDQGWTAPSASGVKARRSTSRASIRRSQIVPLRGGFALGRRSFPSGRLHFASHSVVGRVVSVVVRRSSVVGRGSSIV